MWGMGWDETGPETSTCVIKLVSAGCEQEGGRACTYGLAADERGHKERRGGLHAGELLLERLALGGPGRIVEVGLVGDARELEVGVGHGELRRPRGQRFGPARSGTSDRGARKRGFRVFDKCLRVRLG